MSSLVKRLIFGFTAFFSILLIIWVGLPLLIPLYIFVTIVAIEEYTQIMKLKGIPIRKRSIWVAALLTLPASLPVSFPGMQPFILGVSWREALIGIVVFYLVTLEIIRPNDNSMFAAIFSFFGYLYIPWMLGYVITLRYTPDGSLGFWYLLLPMLAIIATDVGAYTFGRLFGKTRLAPNISPNKTVEGALGGLGLAIIVVTSLLLFMKLNYGINIDLFDAILFSILASCSAQLGDLFESLIKRWAGVKDTGSFMPGHGGMLDRIDSIIFAVPLTFYFVSMFILR